MKKQVFQYTDNGLVSLNHLQSQNTGAYTGEGSLIYAYLSLYRLTNEKVYLQYAVKHAGIVSQILEEDSCSDLLGGKAGAAWVFLQLYQETQNQRYIQEAERAICLMLPQMIKTECGVGWNPESVDVPIGGMAHGNAGILMPVLVYGNLQKRKSTDGWQKRSGNTKSRCIGRRPETGWISGIIAMRGKIPLHGATGQRGFCCQDSGATKKLPIQSGKSV